MTDNYSALERARNRKAELVSQQRFQLHWRGSGESELFTLEQLCAYLNLKPQSVRVYLAKGHGSFDIVRANPLTGEPDALTITRLKPERPAKRPVGRPPHQYDSERLGTEFGTPLASKKK
jgi:hypothetical protein